MMDYIKSGGCYEPLMPPEDSSLSSLSEDVAFADITKETPEEFAKQITLIELSFFKAIKREEFTSLKWNGREKHIYAPNIVASTRWFNQINFWVQKEILKYSCVSKRTELLAFFIKIAKKLVDYNNLYSAMSIVSALQVECIYRLRHTWAGLGNKDRATYRRLEELFSQDDNCRRQREHMSSITLPGIPYLGLYLSDLTYTNVAQPRVNGKPTPTWYAKINAIVETIAYFQQSKYNFVVDETINVYLCAQRYIEELQKFLEEDNYKTSLALEPPPPPPIAPSSLCVSPGDKHHKFGRDSLKLGHHDSSPSADLINSSSSSGFAFGFRSPSKLSSIHLGGKTHQRNNSTASSTTTKATASINSSFEADFVPCAKLSCPNIINDSSVINFDLPKVARFDSDFTKSGHEDPTVVRPPKPDPNTNENPWKLGKSDELCGKLKSTVQPSPGTDDLTKSPCDLPPIPPRPSIDSPKVAQICPSANSSNDPPCLNNCNVAHASPLGDKFTVHATSTLPSRLSLSTCETSDPTALGTSSDLTPKLSSLNLMDSSTAAACAAVVAANLVDTSLLSPPTLSPSRHGPDNTMDRKYLANQSFEALATSTPPCSPKSLDIQPNAGTNSMNSSVYRTPDPLSIQFGVRVICQGVVQRRTVARRSRQYNHDLTNLLLTKRSSSPQSISTIYASTSSLSTCSAVGSQKQTVAPASRPASFSKWRRLWATLVLVGEGLAAYMIYFEPRSKNATQRDEFQAHQCQIHCLARLPFQLPNHAPLEDIEQEDEESKEVEVAEGSELLDDSFIDKSRPSSLSTSQTSSSSKWRLKGSRDLSVPCVSLSNLAKVEPGRHRDGNPDLTSFFLTDPLQGKTYRFRPLAIHPSTKLSNRQDPLRSSSSAFSWFRRGATPATGSTNFTNPRVFPRSQLISPDQSPSSPSLGRARGLSAPGLFALPNNETSQSAKLPTRTEQDQVNQWLIALQTTLAKLKDTQRRQFAAYYASRCVSLTTSSNNNPNIGNNCRSDLI